MNLSNTALKQLLQNNVVELIFSRRNIRKNRPTQRRMLATLNFNILNSNVGQKVFNFKIPTSYTSYDVNSYKLLTVFDIFMQDWRNIPTDSVNIVQILPSDPVEKFWEYFDNVLSKMSASQKAVFMDS